MDEDNKKMFISIIVIFVVTGVLLTYVRFMSFSNTQRPDERPETASNIQEERPSVADTSAPVITTADYVVPTRQSAGAVILKTGATFPRQSDTYEIATENYQGYRMHFENCVATSPLVGATLTSGTVIMLEGKSADPQTIYLAGGQYVLHGYDFMLIKVPTVTKVQKFYVDCEMLDQRQYKIATLTIYP